MRTNAGNKNCPGFLAESPTLTFGQLSKSGWPGLNTRRVRRLLPRPHKKSVSLAGLCLFTFLFYHLQLKQHLLQEVISRQILYPDIINRQLNGISLIPMKYLHLATFSSRLSFPAAGLYFRSSNFLPACRRL